MTRNIPMIEARRKLTNLPEEFQKKPELGAVAVTRRGRPVLAVIPWELYESIVETLEVLSDEKLMMDLKQSIKEVRAGRLIPWEKIKKELDL